MNCAIKNGAKINLCFNYTVNAISVRLLNNTRRLEPLPLRNYRFGVVFFASRPEASPFGHYRFGAVNFLIKEKSSFAFFFALSM